MDDMKFNCHGKLANRQGQQMLMKKKYSIANRIKAKYLMRNREAARKIIRQQNNNNKKISGPSLQICKGKRVLEPSNSHIYQMDVDQVSSDGVALLEPSNSHIYQMDVDQALAVHSEEGIIMNILSRLPVRSLHQFKCVSKFWNALISDPYFKMKHLKHAKNNRNSQKFLITHMSRNGSRFSSYCVSLSSVQMAEDAEKLVRPLSSKPFFRAKCACNGLVVVVVSDIMTGSRPIHLLWNPSIRESIVLPTSEFELDDSTRYGFGYDKTSGDYKILRICDASNEILALKGGSWRKIDKHPHCVRNVVSFTSSLAFVHEAFHWIGSSGDWRPRKYSLVSFSISKEMYGEIPLPEEVLSSVGKSCFGVSVLDGMLCVHSVTSSKEVHGFKLWVLKEYGVTESWSALFTLEDCLIYGFIPAYRFADGELLFCCAYLPSGGPVFRTSSGPFVSWLQAGLVDGEAFTESLISPKSLTH